MSSLRTLVADSSNPKHRQLVSDALTAASRLAPEQQAMVPNPEDLTLNDAVVALKAIRANLPDSRHDETSTNFLRLDGVLLPLITLQREMEISCIIGPYPEVSEDGFDVLISDIKPEDLPKEVSQALDIPYLAPGRGTQWPLNGIVYGRHRRVLFSIPVTGRGKSVQAHFIFNTGAPRTYIALSVLEALGIPEASFGNEVIRINGVKADVGISDTTTIKFTTPAGKSVELPCHFTGLNLMGMDFLDRLEGLLTVDMANNKVSLATQRQT